MLWLACSAVVDFERLRTVAAQVLAEQFPSLERYRPTWMGEWVQLPMWWPTPPLLLLPLVEEEMEEEVDEVEVV